MGYSKEFEAVKLVVIDKLQALAEQMGVLRDEFDGAGCRKLGPFADENDVVEIDKAFFDGTFVLGQYMDNHVAGEYRILWAGFADGGFDLNLPSVGCDGANEVASKDIHKRFFELPVVCRLVEKFLEPEFPVNLFLLVQGGKYGLFDGADADVANHSDFAVGLVGVAVGNGAGGF